MCPACGGSGWVFIERNGASGAKRCSCRQPPPRPDDGEPTVDEYASGALTLSRVMRFFPQDEITIRFTARKLKALARTRSALWWLVDTLPEAFSEWPGHAAMRQFFCTRYNPPDGIGPDPSDTGAAEMRFIERAGEAFERQLSDWKRQALPPAAEEPPPPEEPQKPPRKLGDRLPVTFEGDTLLQQTFKDAEEQLARDIADTQPLRTPEDRARLIADIEEQLKRRMNGAQK